MSKSTSEEVVRVNYRVAQAYRNFFPEDATVDKIMVFHEGKRYTTKYASGFEGSQKITLTKNGTYQLTVSTGNLEVTLEYTVSGLSDGED